MQDSTKEKLKLIFTSRQFYIALALCVVIAVAGVYYSNSLKEIGKIIEPNTAAPKITQKATEPDGANVNNEIPGMPDVRDKPTEGADVIVKPSEQAVNNPVPETTAIIPTYFSLPLGTDIGMDYSRGVMVFNSSTGDWRTHNGVDFKGAVGDTVKAIAAGKVLTVYDDALWGTVMEIDHGAGIVATYAGLGRGSTLAEGTEVKINDTIGNLGSVPIEVDESPHIHLEIRVNGEINDPLEVMGRSEAENE